MLKQIGTWKLRWKIPALALVLFLGAATLTDAEEKKLKRSVAELQTQIDRLRVELQEAKAEEARSETEAAAGTAKILSGAHLVGREGDDRIGVVMGKPKDGVCPITFYEGGLPNAGYDPDDDDKYVGTAVFGSNFVSDSGESESWFDITLEQKFDGLREEPVEPALRKLKAVLETAIIVEAESGKNGSVVKMIIEKMTIPKNKEWDAVHVELPAPISPDAVSTPRPARVPLNVDLLAGRYLGHEGDDRMGMVLTFRANELRMDVNGDETALPVPVFDVVFYEDGLPGAGHDPKDDDRYEGFAVFEADILIIHLSRKFDEGKAERVEKALQKLIATLSFDQKENVKIVIPRNAQWDAVYLEKSK